MKNKVISVAVILLLVVAVVISVKSGKLNIISNKPKSSIMQNESTEEDTNITNIEQGKQYSEEEIESILDSGCQIVENITDASGKVVEKKIIRNEKIDNANLINVGEESVYEKLKTGVKGEISLNSVRYKIKYIDCKISTKKPQDIDVDFYPIKAQDYYDEEKNLIGGLYYYLTITYDITNLNEEEWEDYGFPIHNLNTGYLYESRFEAQNEPMGSSVTNGTNLKGVVYIEKNETATITNCYVVDEEFLSHDNIVVKVDATGDSKAGKVPYLVIDTADMTED